MRNTDFSKLMYPAVTNIKIITINTWKCDGDYHARMKLLAAQLQALNPDIVACQECFKSEEADTLKFLAGELNMDQTFLPGRYKQRLYDGKWVNSSSGLGILSIHPIETTSEFTLPANEQDDDRKVQQAEIILPTRKRLSIINAHLTHIRDAKLKKAQAAALAIFASMQSDYDYNLVCGDFNAERDSLLINTFMAQTSAIDCYESGDGAEPRCSLTETYEATDCICVDHIFALPAGVENRYPMFKNSAIVLNVADAATGLYPSDHFGLATELIIN